MLERCREMGIYQEKYTKVYFTGKNEDGSPAGYGVEGSSEFSSGGIRAADESILSKIDFTGKRVLEFGFGRGESIKYAIERGAESYEGVDFAPVAVEIAEEFLNKHNIPLPKLHCNDALAFIESCPKDTIYDIVLMLDFIEHVPRSELGKTLMLLKLHLHQNALIAINTPVYREDNDVLQEGLKTSNKLYMFDSTNDVQETSGMHCNLYTVTSLQFFMYKCGYSNVSHAHFFEITQLSGCVSFEVSYKDKWENSKTRGLPLLGNFVEDELEYAYIDISLLHEQHMRVAEEKEKEKEIQKLGQELIALHDALVAQQEYSRELEGQLVTKDEEKAMTEKELVALHDSLVAQQVYSRELEGQLAAKDEERVTIGQALIELRDSLAAQQAYSKTLEVEALKINQTNTSLIELINKFENSTSWRITKPMRVMKSILYEE